MLLGLMTLLSICRLRRFHLPSLLQHFRSPRFCSFIFPDASGTRVDQSGESQDQVSVLILGEGEKIRCKYLCSKRCISKWPDLARIKASLSGIWILMGDFNEVRFPEERRFRVCCFVFQVFWACGCRPGYKT
ncbi:hypothetical protein L1987_26271 [Smallanthus sonchifolius]|uniref:Uncharacterized protein n=1 Tax=Smallanthus sonchifolius TaxID=185202 RepID=A0ACB9IAS4_9ASTR|nr:hypothetical protein L1987_26271 [Smallanthus sonchifolius]